MTTTIRHISYLLCDCDVLAVPGLGVFRRRRVSARFEDAVLLPPSEEVVFVAHEGDDDKVLVKSVARSLACDEAVASKRIAEDVCDIKARLEAGQSVSLGNIGELVPAAALGGINFEVSESWNRSRPLSWLSPVEPLTAQESKENTPSDVEFEKRRNIFIQSLQRTASSAAAIALLVLIAFVASQLPHKNAAEPQMASFGIERVERSSVAEPVGQLAASDKALVLILNTPADGMSIVDPSEKKLQEFTKQIDSADSYFLVVASFVSEEEANKFIAAHHDTQDLRILETDGRCRVYAASGATFSSTKTLADSKGLFDRFPSAWICRK